MMNQVESTCTKATGAAFKSFIAVCSMMLWVLLTSSLCNAQITTTGTINGTVVDQTGAALADASVKITEVNTKVVLKTLTNSSGGFAQVGLSSGNYEVSVSHKGFSSVTETGIYLGPMSTKTVNTALKLGAVSESVTVAASQAQVETTTNELSSTVSGEEAEDLPLNGRNFEQLGSLMPGVVNSSPVATMGTGGYSTNNSLLVNGGTTTGSSGSGETGVIYYLDGIWISSNVVHDENIVTPNPDEITEVKAMQSNYSAQYTLMGASTVVVETKRGTDQFHGGGWEFLRNTALNGTQYFSTSQYALDWHIFGYNLGGPLYIPKVYNPANRKTFFYFNQQWVREKVATQATGQAPLATMRGIGTDGNNDLYFPGMNTASNGKTSPVPGIGGALAVQFLSDPLLTAKGLKCSATSQAGCFPQDSVTGNWIIPAARVDKSAMAFLNAVVPLPNNLGPSGYGPSSVGSNYLNTNPNITDQVDLLGKVDHNFASNLTITGEYMVEEQTFTGGSASRYGTAWANNYDIFKTDDQAGQIRLTKIISPTMTNQTSVAVGIFDGSHDFGGIHLLSQVPGLTQTLPYTGAALMNYLPSTSFSSNSWTKFGTGSSYIVPRATEVHDTITDDWSWLRGKHFIQAGGTAFFGTERHWSWPNTPQGFWTFNGYATTNSMSDYLLGLASAFNQGNNGVRTYATNKIFSPYVEDEYHATRRMTLTAGLRWSYMPWPNEQTGYMVDFNPATFSATAAPTVSYTGGLTFPGGSSQTNGLILNGKNGIPQNLSNAHKNYFAPTFGFAWDVFGTGKTSLRGGYGLTYYATTSQGCAEGGCIGYPTLLSVNLQNSSWDNPAGGATPVTAGAQNGEDLENYRASHIQTFSLSLQQQVGSWLMSIAGAGSVQQAGSTSVNINQPGSAAVNGVAYDFNPLLNCTALNATPVSGATCASASYSSAYFAPYKGYTSISYFENIGKSFWTALEASLQHRVSKNLYLQSAYTWSHGLDNFGGFQSAYNIQAAYGNSGNDIPHVFTTSLTYSLPLLKSSRLWKQEAFGGWKIGDMTTLQSGGTGSVGVSGSGLGLATRPNQIAPVTYPKQWKTKGQLWFSGATSFALPTPGHFGTVGNGTIRMPGTEVYNMSLIKTFPMGNRFKLQFRTEFFNIFNHANPNNPNMTFQASNPQIGQITGAKEPRQGQGSLKLTF